MKTKIYIECDTHTIKPNQVHTTKHLKYSEQLNILPKQSSTLYSTDTYQERN